MAYKLDAVNKAYQLYAQGLPHEEIEKEMKKEYVSWSRQLLYGDDGWIKKYGWEERRTKADAKRQELTDTIASTEELMVNALAAALKTISEKIETQGALVKAEDLAQLNKISGTLNTIRKRMSEGGGYDKARVFVGFLTELMTFLKDRDPEMAATFEADHLDDFIQLVKG